MKKEDFFIHPTAIIEENVNIGSSTKIWHFSHIRSNAKIGQNCILGKNVYIDTNVKIGNNVKIQNNVSVYQGVTLEDGVFVGPHVCFTNDLLPRSVNPDGTLKSSGSSKTKDWKIEETLVKCGASIGANSTILSGLTIGKFALVGAGSVVTKDIPDHGLVYGNPARLRGFVCKCGKKMDIIKKEKNTSKYRCNFCNQEINLKK